MASDIVYVIDTIDVEGAANDVDSSNTVDNWPTGPCPEIMEAVTDDATFVATGSPCLEEDIVIGEGASRGVPPDEVDEWPECPSTGPEPPTAVVAVEPTDPDVPTPCQDCAAEKLDEDVVSAKRPLSRFPNAWAGN